MPIRRRRRSSGRLSSERGGSFFVGNGAYSGGSWVASGVTERGFGTRALDDSGGLRGDLTFAPGLCFWGLWGGVFEGLLCQVGGGEEWDRLEGSASGNHHPSRTDWSDLWRGTGTITQPSGLPQNILQREQTRTTVKGFAWLRVRSPAAIRLMARLTQCPSGVGERALLIVVSNQSFSNVGRRAPLSRKLRQTTFADSGDRHAAVMKRSYS